MKPLGYSRLFLMLIVNVIVMYVLMYAMVDTFGNIYSSLNQFYMALLMASPMLVLELLLMGRMYANKELNFIVCVIGIGLLGLSFFLVRRQVLVDDTSFMRSMISHHAAAILMCKRAHLNDFQVEQLCDNIEKGQQAEIDWMKLKLESLKEPAS